MRRFCTQCGSPIEENARFCSSCGCKIERNENEVTKNNNNAVNLTKEDEVVILDKQEPQPQPVEFNNNNLPFGNSVQFGTDSTSNLGNSVQFQSGGVQFETGGIQLESGGVQFGTDSTSMLGNSTQFDTNSTSKLGEGSHFGNDSTSGLGQNTNSNNYNGMNGNSSNIISGSNIEDNTNNTNSVDNANNINNVNNTNNNVPFGSNTQFGTDTMASNYGVPNNTNNISSTSNVNNINNTSDYNNMNQVAFGSTTQFGTNTTNQFGNASETTTNPNDKSKKSKSGKGGVIAAVAGIVVLVIALIVLVAKLLVGDGLTGLFSSTKGYEKPFEYICEALEKDNASKIESAYLPSTWDSYGVTAEDLLDVLVDAFYDCGDIEDVTYKVRDAKQLTDDDLEEVKEYIEYNYEEDGTIKDAYEVTIKMTVKGEQEKMTTTDDYVVVKLGSKWYITTMTR